MVSLTACVARICVQVPSVMFPRWEMEIGLAWRYGVSCGNCRRGINQVSSSSGWGLGRSLAMIRFVQTLPRGRASSPKPEHWARELFALKALRMLGCFHHSQ